MHAYQFCRVSCPAENYRMVPQYRTGGHPSGPVSPSIIKDTSIHAQEPSQPKKSGPGYTRRDNGKTAQCLKHTYWSTELGRFCNSLRR